MNYGKLYVIGVGPGDPELITVKGLRILKGIRCICVPKGREEGSSLALSIVRGIVDLDEAETLEAHFPMRKMRRGGNPESGIRSEGAPHEDELNSKWDGTVKEVSDRLAKGIDVAFITIGDPTIYSTFFYLYDKLLEVNPGLEIEIVPGVSSINASAARAGISLGLADEKIAVLPATYEDNLPAILEKFDTVVLMKVNKVFDKILTVLSEAGLSEKAVFISRAGMEDEKIFRNIKSVKRDEISYFSMVIVRK